MDRRVDTSSANWKNGIASFVCPFVDPKALATKCEHLGHEGHVFQAAVFVKRREDFLTATDLHPFSSLEV
jgi:hypothetical protein